MTIRAMTAEDWPQVWPFFDEIVRAGETYAYPLDLTSEQARALWTMRRPARRWSWRRRAACSAARRWARNRPGRGDHVGTASFMVSEPARGRGVGRRLGEYVVQWHRDQGYRAIQFNAVVETNIAAVHLWQALGFRVVGTVPEAFDSTRPTAWSACTSCTSAWREPGAHGAANPGRYSVRIARNGASASSWLSTPMPPSQVRWMSR